MDPLQLRSYIVRQHDILCNELRTYVQTRIDLTTQDQTTNYCARVLELLSYSEQHQQLFLPADLAQLRLSCSRMIDALDRYGKEQRDPPLQRSESALTLVPTGGRPRKSIAIDWLAEASSYRGPKGVAEYLPNCSARTVRRRQIDAGIGVLQPPVMLFPPDGPPTRNVASRSRVPARPIPTHELDSHIARLVNQFQNHGRSLLEGQILALGTALGQEVTRADVSASIRRVTGVPAQWGRIPIRPRKYSVAGPGSLWHHDGQHGLIHWKLVIHAFVDGYSRRVMGIRVSNNNRAATVLRLFQDITHEFGFPSRMRGDHGVENLLVAELQELVRGANRGSYIWGPSTLNTRVERIWVDVVVGFVSKWKTFFLDLEVNYGLRRDDVAHIWLLHHLFLDCINYDAVVWAQGWNHHHFTHLPAAQHIRGTHLPSPEELYFFGEYQNGVRTVRTDDDSLIDDEAISHYGAGSDHEDDDDDPSVRRFQVESPDPDSDPDRSTPDAQHDIPPSQRHPNGWGRPRRMFEVRVPEPPSLLPPDTVRELDDHLAAHVDLDAETMPLRRLWWVEALRFLNDNHVVPM